MASFIDVTFISNPAILGAQGITLFVTDGNITQIMFEEFASIRMRNKVAAVGGDTDSTAINYINALKIDYSTTPAYGGVAFVGAGIARLTLKEGWTFVSALAPAYFGVIDLDITNDNTPPPTSLSFTNAFSAHPDACKRINNALTITGGTPPYVINVGGVVESSTTFDRPRGSTYPITITDSLRAVVASSIRAPRSHVNADFNVNIIQTPNGSTVTIQTINRVSGLTLEYSLDGGAFSSNNTFSGQGTGNFSVRVRDQYGCIVTLNYSISDISPEPLDPFFLLSEANSFRFYEVQEDTALIRANYYNRRSCKEDVKGIAYKNIQFFEPNDNRFVQLKTNHDDLNVKLVNADGSETPVAVFERVTNIGLKDSRDCKYFRLDSSHIAVFFDSGNTYTPDSNNVTGTYSQLNGILPSFITEGLFITVIGLGTKEVITTEFDQDRNVWYAKVSGSLASGPDITARCNTTYNNQPYNVHEFTPSFVLNAQYYIEITTNKVTYRSEEIRIISKVRGLTIEYWNTENRFDMVYSSEPLIKNLLRLPDMDIVKLTLDPTIENYQSDNDPIQLDGKLYKNFELRGEDLSTAMAFKVTLALMHNAVFVNGVEMTIKEVSQFESVENTNLYNVRFVMEEGGNAAERQLEQVINVNTLEALALETSLGFLNISQ